eukprot:2186886-Pyramimonas_sp.AAC.1
MWRLAGGVTQQAMRRQMHIDPNGFKRQQNSRAVGARNNGDAGLGREPPAPIAAGGLLEGAAM